MKRGLHIDGAKLRDWRTARGLSQMELAERAGLAYATVNRLENGRHTTTFKTIEKLAKGLDLGSVWLLDASPTKVLAGSANGGGSDVALDFSYGAGTALMDRVEAGATEEVEEREALYFEFLPRYEAERGGQDAVWTIESFERDLGYALAALASKDREEGAEEIRRVLGRLRQRAQEEG